MPAWNDNKIYVRETCPETGKDLDEIEQRNNLHLLNSVMEYENTKYKDKMPEQTITLIRELLNQNGICVTEEECECRECCEMEQVRAAAQNVNRLYLKEVSKCRKS